MKLLYIGQSVEDYIYIDEQIINKGGGLLYSVAGVVSFLENEDEIYPVTQISKETKHLFENIYQNVKGNYISIVDQIPQNHLILHKNKERDEKYKYITHKIDIKSRKIDFSVYDGILLNMITGFDIELNDLVYIRKRFDKIIYMDVHTLARGIDENYHRYFRKIENFDKWIRNIDIIQANENEILYVSPFDDLDKIVDYLFDNGLSLLLLTLGEKGSKIYYKDRGKISNIIVKAYNSYSQNTVGCGDTFGSVFFYHYLKTKDLIYSSEIASKAAATITKFNSIEEFMRLKNETEK